MPIITGGKIIEGSSYDMRTSVIVNERQALQGGMFTSPGLPAGGYLNGIAHPNALVIRVDTGVIYRNTGTLGATVWTQI